MCVCVCVCVCVCKRERRDKERESYGVYLSRQSMDMRLDLTHAWKRVE